MSTVSARIDDNVKAEAERIADEIGITVSGAINIFLKRFIAENGFPFDVTAAKKREPIFDTSELTAAVRSAVADEQNDGRAKTFTYLDPQSGYPVTVNRDEV